MGLRGAGTGTITGVTAGTDLTGGGTSGNVTLNLNTAKVPQLAAANTFTANQTVNGNVTATGTVDAAVLNATDETLSDGLSINSAATNPLYVATSSSVRTTAIYGAATSTTGTAFGMEGVTASSGPGAYGVVGNAIATSGTPYGVYGIVGSSLSGVGVFGQNGAESSTGQSLASVGYGAGAWADGGASSIALVGTTDDSYAGVFHNSSSTRYTLAVANLNASGSTFSAFNGAQEGCYIDGGGNINCTGSKNAIVPIDGGKRTVAMSAIESPQNWFEDAGSGQLSDGKTVVTLDPNYIQTVNTELEYQVFLTPYGDCKGLYVANRTATSFEVHELGAGTANVGFGYRVMALRRNYENVRFADHTRDADAMKLMQERAKAAAAHPQASKKLIPAIPAGATSGAPIAGNATTK